MFRPITRTVAFFHGWVAEVIQQPALILTVIAGPFLVLFAFGEGVNIGGPMPSVMLVEQGTADPHITQALNDYVKIAGTTDNLEAARAALSRGDVDAVLLLPDDPQSFLQHNEHIPIRVFVGDIDPVRLSYSQLYLKEQVSELNQQAVAQAIHDATANGGTAAQLASGILGTGGSNGGGGGGAVDAQLLSAPYALDVKPGLSYSPSFTTFYAPAVLSLLLQHIAITLAALSIVRLRAFGIADVIRVSPARAIEVVIGHYLSYGTLALLAGAALLAGMVGLLGVPVFGSWLLLAATMVLLVFLSLGVGFVISTLSTSQHHAAQTAMLILLASIFLSGFAFSLDRISWPVRAIAYVLPATYAIRLSQEVMLRGVVREPWDFAVLGGAGAAMFVLAVLLTRRAFRAT